MEEVLLDLEPWMREVAQRGADFQGKVGAQNKSNTGNFASDVVTEADLWVQTQLLEQFLNTPLRDCQLVAEETSESLEKLQSQFAAHSEYQLLIDPIDGTKRFVEGLPYFSTIVSLRHRHHCLYTFCYYPKLHWWLRLIGTHGWETSGPLDFDIPTSETKTVVYTSGTPEVDFSDWRSTMPGWNWLKGDEIHPCGSKLLYLSGTVAGYASSRPNQYDGLMLYHYAKVRRHNLREVDGGGKSPLDLSQHESTSRGQLLSGRYFCWQVGT